MQIQRVSLLLVEFLRQIANFVDYAQFNEEVGFYDDVYISYYTGRLLIPSVLQSISDDGSFTILDKQGDNDCHNAVNFCDLETVYQNMLTKFGDLNDQIEDLLDSIDKLNKKVNTPKDGEACPTTPTVTDYYGTTYPTVRIGNQCWMRENMRSSYTSSSSFSGNTTPTYSSYRQ